MTIRSISIGCDHGGFIYKASIIRLLNDAGIATTNHGTNSNTSVDYPDFVHPVALDVENRTANLGIVLCGSGNGAAMTANKHQGIRAALCWSVELAELARKHNNANILAIPARFITQETALAMVRAFISTDFEEGRHTDRVKKIACS